jgi:hypothetical protein
LGYTVLYCSYHYLGVMLYIHYRRVEGEGGKHVR